MNLKCVLLVEDDPDLMTLYGEYITRAFGDAVFLLKAYTVHEGISAAENIQFDAVVSCYRLPDGVGTQVTEFIKNLCNRLPNIKKPHVVLASASPPFDTGPAAKESGIDEVIMKGSHFNALIGALEDKLGLADAAL